MNCRGHIWPWAIQRALSLLYATWMCSLSSQSKYWLFAWAQLVNIIWQCCLTESHMKNKCFKVCLYIHLRLCKTAITWLPSLSAILPLFWRHDIAELHRLCREDFRNVLWRHEICEDFPRFMNCALQNMQFLQYFTTKFNIFSLNLTGESDFFILFISTHNKFSTSGF